MAGLLQNIKLPANNIPWLENIRKKGRCAFAKNGLPNAKTEAWKYTRPRDLQVDDFVMAENMESCPRHKCECENCECEKASTEQMDFSAYEIHIENGCLQKNHWHLPEGVIAMGLMEAIVELPEVKNYLGKLVEVDNYPFADLNSAYLNEGIFICVGKGVKLDKPIALIYHNHSCAENLFYNLRNIIVLENKAEAEIVEYNYYSGEEKSRYFANIVNEIFVAPQAKLNHYKCQNEAYKAVHIALSVVKLRKNATYKSFCLQRGANLARNESKILLCEEQAKAEVNAAYIMNGWATIDTSTNVEHIAPYTFSKQLVKGVVGGDAKGVFQGKIHIAPNAIKTEGQLLHRAILLSDNAEIDCKPELEIFADDVKCSHGAATGELDEEQLFYMQSRGIDLDEAKQILVDAYLSDVLFSIENEDIRNWFITKAK